MQRVYTPNWLDRAFKAQEYRSPASNLGMAGEPEANL